MATPPVTAIDFELRQRSGRVLIRYGVNGDPARWGYPLLGMASLVEASRGFPVVQAEVEYDAEGYAAVLAWVQLVRMTDLDSGESDSLVDLAPPLAGLDLPYVSFGVRPTLFDAPSTAGTDNMDWHAHAFLVVSPDCLMTRRIRPVCAFAWGFELRDGRPQPTDLQVLDSSVWPVDQSFLSERHQSWTFEDWT